MSERSPKAQLLVLTSTFPRWPSDHEPPFVFELARRLTAHFDVTVLAPHAPGAKTREIMDGVAVERFRYAPERLERLAYQGGIPSKLHEQPLLALLVPLFLAAQFSATCRLLRRRRPQAVHAHWLITSGLIALLARRCCFTPTRVVVTAHGGDVYGLRHPILQRVKRWVMGKADVVTVVSEALADHIKTLGIKPKQLVIQSMGTDLQTLFIPRSTAPRHPVIVYAGRLVSKKGIDTLLHATAELLPSMPTARVVIAGHGPQQPSLAALSTDLGIASAVSFTGPYQLSDLPHIYAKSTLAVFPFRAAESGDQDGLGLAVIEAMGCEVPVISSDLPALDELVEQDVTGLKVPVDNPVALAQTIQRCLQDPVSAAHRAKTARRRVLQRYDWQHVATRYALLLDGTPGLDIAPRNSADN